MRHSGCAQAFELRVRPALDSPTAALDRLKMNIYIAVRALQDAKTLIKVFLARAG